MLHHTGDLPSALTISYRDSRSLTEKDAKTYCENMPPRERMKRKGGEEDGAGTTRGRIPGKMLVVGIPLIHSVNLAQTGPSAAVRVWRLARKWVSGAAVP